MVDLPSDTNSIFNYELAGNDFIRSLVHLILDDAKIIGNAQHIANNHAKVIDFKYPVEIEKIFDYQIGEHPETASNLLDICRKTIAHSLKTNHPNYTNLLFAGGDQYALAASWLTDALNNTMSTWEFAPVFQVIENHLIESMGKLTGFQNVQGVFTPGGSMANCYAMLLARHRIFPNFKVDGIFGHSPKLVMFVSDQAHYSFSKMAIVLGHGTASVIKVPTDKFGRMIPGELESAILQSKKQHNLTPFMVAATSGTTVLGAHDPLVPIAQICKRHNLWFHVDGALGGAWLFSRKHRHLLKGLELADSFTWDFYKVLSFPVYCCAILVNNHKEIFTEAFSLNAEYLFQEKYYNQSYDRGDSMIQCIQKVDSFKLFLFLKAHGLDRMEAMVDRAFELSRYFEEQVSTRANFRLLFPQSECNNVCFHFIPDAYIPVSLPLTTTQHLQICIELKRRMMQTGSMVMTYQPIGEKGIAACFRINFSAIPIRCQRDVQLIIDKFEQLGKDIVLE